MPACLYFCVIFVHATIIFLPRNINFCFRLANVYWKIHKQRQKFYAVSVSDKSYVINILPIYVRSFGECFTIIVTSELGIHLRQCTDYIVGMADQTVFSWYEVIEQIHFTQSWQAIECHLKYIL